MADPQRGWTVLGEDWLWSIVTVGAGRQYANLNTALAARSGNTIFLLYDAGTVTLSGSLYDKAAGVYAILGMVAGITINFNYRVPLHFEHPAKTFVFDLVGINFSNGSLTAGNCTGSRLIFNRCNLLGYFSAAAGQTAEIRFLNCTAAESIAPFMYGSGSNWWTSLTAGMTLSKCILNSLHDDTPPPYAALDYRFRKNYSLVHSTSARTWNGGVGGTWQGVIDLGAIRQIGRVDFLTLDRTDGWMKMRYSEDNVNWSGELYVCMTQGYPYPSALTSYLNAIYRWIFPAITARYVQFYLSELGTTMKLSSLQFYSVTGDADLTGYGVDYGEPVITQPPRPIVTTQAATAVAGKSFTANGTIYETGATYPSRRGFCVLAGSTGSPTLSDQVVQEEGIFETGAFSLSIPGLAYNTSYRVCAFAENEDGVGYGNVVDVLTLKGVPEVSTASPPSIATEQATLAGSIDDPGGVPCTRRGFCAREGSTGTPALSDVVVEEAGSFNAAAFALVAHPLVPETSYRIRAFAYNSEGAGYGETLTMRTQAYADPIRACPACAAIFLEDRAMMIDELVCPVCGASLQKV